MDTTRSEDWGLKWNLLVADAWADPALKKRLLSDPATVLKERGIVVPAGKQLKVLEATDDVYYFVLPPQPSAEELSEEELETVAGGNCGGGHHHGGGHHGGGGHHHGGCRCGIPLCGCVIIR